FFFRWGASAADREREGSDLETMGRKADAGNERRGAERQEAASLCRPVALLARGVPGQLLFLQPMYFLQRPNEVLMIWERDQWVRRVRLTEKHSEHVKPSWFGESIGHYEGGDTLVVDTIGLAAGDYHYIDSFRTPHTEKLHVVERFTISQDGRALTAIVTVEDPDTFNGPLTLKQTWRKNPVTMGEVVCAETAGVDYFNQNLHPIPQADKPDF